MIYTKTGDNGTTSLVGGTRVSKCDPQVEAYGTVDELNAHIGLLAEMLRPENSSWLPILKEIQNNLFIIQTLLATEPDCKYQLPPLPDGAVKGLEQHIDQLQESLPKLHSFVIPGGTLAGAQCHVARTVCRRAERRIVQMTETVTVVPEIRHYINRLSDFLFVLSRHLVVAAGAEELLYNS